MQPDISVIAVTYNSEPVIETFLETLDEMVRTLSLSVETILADNASQDGSQKIIRQVSPKYPRLNIVVVLNEKNVGLSKALNDIIGLCRGERVLICNPDITFNESFREMLKVSEQCPELVLVPELLESDGTPQRVIYRRFPTVLRIVSDFTAIGDSVPGLFDKIRKDYRYIGRGFKRPMDSLEQTAAVCMLIDRKVADMFHPFYDPAFPVFWNDVDMSKRAQMLGIRLAIVPGTKIYHGLGQSAKKSNPEKIAMLFYSSHGMIGYAKRWDMYPSMLRLILFSDSILRILREVIKRMIGRKTRRLARTRELSPFREMTKKHLLAFRCSLR